MLPQVRPAGFKVLTAIGDPLPRTPSIVVEPRYSSYLSGVWTVIWKIAFVLSLKTLTVVSFA